jgi:RimJ/RimL family protein N-acetyltransferase
MSLKLEYINFNDKNLLNKIYIWRNDENTRLNSLNTNIITIEIFNKIINKYKESNLKPLIIYDNNIEIGIVTFIQEKEYYYIGINICQEYRNKGIGKKTLNLLINSKLFNNKKIIAKIKKINKPSINIFSNYFTYLKEDNDFIEYIFDNTH